MGDSCAHTPLKYSSARAAFWEVRSSSFCLETDFGRALEEAVVEVDGVAALEEDDDEEDDDDVTVSEEEGFFSLVSSKSMPSMEDVVDEDAMPSESEFARFILNCLQSPREFGSMTSSSSSSSSLSSSDGDAKMHHVRFESEDDSDVTFVMAADDDVGSNRGLRDIIFGCRNP